MPETKKRKRRQRPYPLKKPITRRVDDDLVVVVKDDGLELRVYGHQKSATLPWSSIIDLAVRSALNGRLPGRLFPEAVFPDAARITGFSKEQLARISAGTESNHQPERKSDASTTDIDAPVAALA